MATIYRHWFPCTVTLEHPHGKGYSGRTYRTLEERDRERFRPSQAKDSVGLKRAIVKYGQENMQTDIIEDNILPIPDLVDEREIYWIAYFDDFHNGYNQTKGGDGIDPETAREINRKRVADGTHNFLGGEINRKRLEDGTHHLLGGEINRKRVADGTHNFLCSETARKKARKRIEDGTHNLLGENRSPESEKKRIKAYRNTCARKRHKVYWYYIIALARYWYETHAYIIQCREAFDNKAIPDTSDAKQLSLF